MSTAMADTSSLESTRKAEPRSFWTLLKQTFDFVLSQWLLLAIGLVILLAHFFPQVGKRGGYIRSEYTINYGAVAIIFLASGLTLPFDQLVKHAKNIRLHLIVQVTSFLITSAVFFGIAAAASTSRALETSTLVGLVATGCLPTTISSNVVMTRQAGGDVAATMVEVTLGNILGPFISPLLLVKLYLPAISAFKAAWIPAEATDNLTGMYGQVMKQMGLSVYVPLFIGQVIRGIWPKQVSTFAAKCRLAKIGSLCLISLIWSTFCTAFASGSLETLNPPTIAFNVMINLALCIAFTGFSFMLCRPPKSLVHPIVSPRISKLETISICFCAPAKTQALGIPLIAAMYASSTDMTRALIQVPMILYTAEQILVGQVLVVLFKRWLAKEKIQEASLEQGPEPEKDSIGA